MYKHSISRVQRCSITNNKKYAIKPDIYYCNNDLCCNLRVYPPPCHPASLRKKQHPAKKINMYAVKKFNFH